MAKDFASLPISDALRATGKALGYGALTPIQAAAIPVLLDGRDLLGQSSTGSGKTVAFAVPVLERLDARTITPQALVLCPTRELCTQVAGEFRKLARATDGLRVLGLTGGSPVRSQIDALQRGVHVLVGTPGRVLDHLGRDTLDPGGIATVILDEADRMLDMGFGPDVERILAALPDRRQTALLSATFPDAIESLARAHLRDPVRVRIDEGSADIRQLALAAEPDQKLHALCWLLREYPSDSALVFCNLKATVAELEQALSGGGVSADCLHGDIEQFYRDQVMARFRNRSVRVLIATDVAARGIDVDDLDLVVNYELPPQAQSYVHRIGRTGRAGKRGLAVSLTTARQKGKLAEIERDAGAAIERVRHPAGGHREAVAAMKSIAGGAPMETILISGGRKDKVRPGDVLGALTGDAGGLSADDVGKIEVQDRLTYVAVSRGVSREATAQLNRGRIKGKRFRATLTGGKRR